MVDRRTHQRAKLAFQCLVGLPMVLSFLQDFLDRGESFSTIKIHLTIYLTAIYACHVGIGTVTLSVHQMPGARTPFAKTDDTPRGFIWSPLRTPSGGGLGDPLYEDSSSPSSCY